VSASIGRETARDNGVMPHVGNGGRRLGGRGKEVDRADHEGKRNDCGIVAIALHCLHPSGVENSGQRAARVPAIRFPKLPWSSNTHEDKMSLGQGCGKGIFAEHAIYGAGKLRF
jgi:hypothetical protein